MASLTRLAPIMVTPKRAASRPLGARPSHAAISTPPGQSPHPPPAKLAAFITQVSHGRAEAWIAPRPAVSNCGIPAREANQASQAKRSTALNAIAASRAGWNLDRITASTLQFDKNRRGAL